MPIRQLCSLFDVHVSGYYAWLKKPQSSRQKRNKRLTGLIKQFWLESGCVYGYRKIHRDIRDSGETAGINQVHRLMSKEGLKAQVGYRKPRHHTGESHVIAANNLSRQFNPDRPDHSWVTDITYIRTHEGWLYLAAVMDLFSRRIIGWAMGARMTKELVLDALMMAVWRRNPKHEVLIHSDQGSQFTSHDWNDFLKAHNLKGSMSRRGNCHDNASFFQLLMSHHNKVGNYTKKVGN